MRVILAPAAGWPLAPAVPAAQLSSPGTAQTRPARDAGRWAARTHGALVVLVALVGSASLLMLLPAAALVQTTSLPTRTVLPHPDLVAEAFMAAVEAGDTERLAALFLPDAEVRQLYAPNFPDKGVLRLRGLSLIRRWLSFYSGNNLHAWVLAVPHSGHTAWWMRSDAPPTADGIWDPSAWARSQLLDAELSPDGRIAVLSLGGTREELAAAWVGAPLVLTVPQPPAVSLDHSTPRPVPVHIGPAEGNSWPLVAGAALAAGAFALMRRRLRMVPKCSHTEGGGQR